MVTLYFDANTLKVKGQLNEMMRDNSPTRYFPLLEKDRRSSQVVRAFDCSDECSGFESSRTIDRKLSVHPTMNGTLWMKVKGSERGVLGPAFHVLLPKTPWALNPIVPMLWDTFTFIETGFIHFLAQMKHNLVMETHLAQASWA